MKTNTQIRIGIVGAGYISDFHARGILESLHANLIAIADFDNNKRNAFADRYHLQHVYASCEELLEEDIIDAVIISTPNKYHAPYVMMALDKGIHTFVEKPMAMNVQEALVMKLAAEQSGKVLMIGHMWRFDREAAYIADAVKRGDLGKIYKTVGYGISVNWGPAGWFTQKEFAGGGSLSDMGIHAIDTSRFILGDPKPVSVYAKVSTNIIDANIDDTATLMITWDNDCYSIIESGWWQPHMDGPEAATRIYGTLGYGSLFPTGIEKSGIRLNELHQPIKSVTEKITPEFPERVGHCDQHMYTRQMQAFINAIIEGCKAIPGPDEGLVNMRIIEAAYTSASSGKVIILDE